MTIQLIFSKYLTLPPKQELTELFRKVCLAAEVFRSGEPEATRILSSRLPDGIKLKVQLEAEELVYNHGEEINTFKKRVLALMQDYQMGINQKELQVIVISPARIENTLPDLQEEKPTVEQPSAKLMEDNYEELAKEFIPAEPQYSFDRVILPEETLKKINEAIGIKACEKKVFEDWGLSEIQPHPSSALSFFGPAGTGKTMAAEAIANKLGKKILEVAYADVESKYHGEGPKRVKAIFRAAEKADAVLFFDEADSLLSKRLTQVNQGSEQAINSMRSQLLISLESFQGIVIFATNLVVNYDRAFLTRLISIPFPLPDEAARRRIWENHLRPLDDGRIHKLNIPLADNVSIDELATQYEFVGREIRNAVVTACISVAMADRDLVTQGDLLAACERIVREKKDLENATVEPGSQRTEQSPLAEAIKRKVKEREEVQTDVSRNA